MMQRARLAPPGGLQITRPTRADFGELARFVRALLAVAPIRRETTGVDEELARAACAAFDALLERFDHPSSMPPADELVRFLRSVLEIPILRTRGDGGGCDHETTELALFAFDGLLASFGYDKPEHRQ